MSCTQVRVPDREQVLMPVCQACPACGQAMRIRYENRRTPVTLTGTVRLRLKIRRCEAADCSRFHEPYRPEAEGALALPQHEFGRDVVALVGALRQYVFGIMYRDPADRTIRSAWHLTAVAHPSTSMQSSPV